MATVPISDSTCRIVVSEPRIMITNPLALEVPDGSKYLAGVAEEDRKDTLRRMIDMGGYVLECAGTSTTLRLVEAELAGMTEGLSTRLTELLNQERGESQVGLQGLLEDHRTKLGTALTRYLDPESSVSLPVSFQRILDAGSATLFAKLQALLADGEGGALDQLAERLVLEVRRSTTTIVEQIGARHAMMTKTSLAGRPYEDSLEETLLQLLRPLGDTVVRCGDTPGLGRSKAGDFVITINPGSLRGLDRRIVVEAKRRGDGAQGFSETEIRTALVTARRNRGAHAGLFVVDNSARLPLGVGFHELSSSDIAVAYDPEAGDLALAVALRVLRSGIVSKALANSNGQDVDREAARQITGEIRERMGQIQAISSSHQTAMNGITKASTALTGLETEVSRLLGKLDGLF